jgi:hypothetical protein
MRVGKYPSVGIFFCMCGTCKHKEDEMKCRECRVGHNYEEADAPR